MASIAPAGAAALAGDGRDRGGPDGDGIARRGIAHARADSHAAYGPTRRRSNLRTRHTPRRPRFRFEARGAARVTLRDRSSHGEGIASGALDCAAVSHGKGAVRRADGSATAHRRAARRHRCVSCARSPRTREVDPRRLLAGRVQSLDRCGNGSEARRRKDIAVSVSQASWWQQRCWCSARRRRRGGASDPIAGARYVGRLRVRRVVQEMFERRQVARCR